MRQFSRNFEALWIFKQTFCVNIFELALDSPTAEYVLSGSEDNIVAYRIVHMPDEPSIKQNNNHHHQQQQHSIQTTQAINGGSVSTGPTQHLQYIVIDSANGFLQAVPANQITTVASSPIKTEPNTNGSASTLSSILSSSTSSSTSTSMQPIAKMRTSIAIAPKVEPHYASATTYTTTATNNTNSKSNVSILKSVQMVLITLFVTLLIGFDWFFHFVSLT